MGTIITHVLALLAGAGLMGVYGARATSALKADIAAIRAKLGI